MAEYWIEHGADLSLRVKLPGHYDQPEEIVVCTPRECDDVSGWRK